jgi:DNA (cytosine-5)-methyltransferase 1
MISEGVLKFVGVFAGIGGLELGLKSAGHSVVAIAENDPFACKVLASRFDGVPNLGDVTQLSALPYCDLVSCGFPCQDLSPAGNGAGIHGTKSRLIREMLRLLDAARRKPAWLLFENVPFMLSLKHGAGMRYLTSELESRGYGWAYRVIDSRAFGLAQRRRRLFILAGRSEEPARLLFRDTGSAREPQRQVKTPCGFYWTEGNQGVGWAVDATPPLKGGSGIAIISPPGIWRPVTKDFVTPTIQDAEALQGFRRGWTSPSRELSRGDRERWRLVGNAVSVPVAKWFGRLLNDLRVDKPPSGVRVHADHPWPTAGYGFGGVRYKVEVSEWPGRKQYVGLDSFLSADAPLLSARAAGGFLARLEKSSLRVPQDFLHDLRVFVANGSADRSRYEQTHGPYPRPRQSARKGVAVGSTP